MSKPLWPLVAASASVLVAAVALAQSSDRTREPAIHGRVVDSEGRPVAGAWVDAVVAGDALCDDPFGARAGRSRTDAEGRYSLPPPPTSTCTVAAIHLGHALGAAGPIALAWASVTAIVAPDIILAPLGVGTVEAHARLRGGDAYEGPLRLRARRLGDALPASEGTEEFVSDYLGAIRPSLRLTAGAYEVVAEATGLRSAPLAITVAAQAEGAPTLEATFTLGALPGLRVRLLDESGGPASRVWITLDAGRGIVGANSDVAGIAFFERMPAGEYRFGLGDSEEYGGAAVGERAYPVLREEAPRIVVDATAPSQAVTVRLLRGIAVEGQVVDPGGAPVEGATVLAFDDRDPDLARVARSGAGGRFRLSGLGSRDPAELTLRVLGKGFSFGEARARVASIESPRRLVLALREAVTVTGVVLDFEGKPAAGARVCVVPSHPPGEHDGRERSRLWESYLTGRACTGANGVFRCEDVPPGFVDVRASHGSPRLWIGNGSDAPGRVEASATGERREIPTIIGLETRVEIRLGPPRGE